MQPTIGGLADHIINKEIHQWLTLFATSLTGVSHTIRKQTAWQTRHNTITKQLIKRWRLQRKAKRLILDVRVDRHSLQEWGSSEPSEQSDPPSQYQWAGMQRPLEQRNSLWEQVDAAMWRKQTGIKSLRGFDQLNFTFWELSCKKMLCRICNVQREILLNVLNVWHYKVKTALYYYLIKKKG